VHGRDAKLAECIDDVQRRSVDIAYGYVSHVAIS
jgi:hypothetical protein